MTTRSYPDTHTFTLTKISRCPPRHPYSHPDTHMSSEQGLHGVLHSLATPCLPTELSSIWEHTALSCGSQEVRSKGSWELATMSTTVLEAEAGVSPLAESPSSLSLYLRFLLFSLSQKKGKKKTKKKIKTNLKHEDKNIPKTKQNQNYPSPVRSKASVIRV